MTGLSAGEDLKKHRIFCNCKSAYCRMGPTLQLAADDANAGAKFGLGPRERPPADEAEGGLIDRRDHDRKPV